jgi:hypothetical protein
MEHTINYFIGAQKEKPQRIVNIVKDNARMITQRQKS